MRVIEKIKTFLNIRYDIKEGRNPHIDALKGIAMIVVVWGHSVQVHDANFDANLIFRLIYSFHMPMFMFLSGYVLAFGPDMPYAQHVRKNAIRLLIPFLIWYLVSYAFARLQSDVSLWIYFWELAKSPGRGLWFLWIVFLNSALLLTALSLARCKNWRPRENYFVFAAIGLSLAASPDFLALADVKQYFPYYAAGFFAFKYRDFIFRQKFLFALSLIIFPLLALSWQRNAHPLFYPQLLELIRFESIARLIESVYKYIVAFSGIAFCACAVTFLRKTPAFSLLCWLGLFTLDIYACHSYFMIGFGSGAWRYLSASALALVAALALSILILRRFRITRLLFLGQKQ